MGLKTAYEKNDVARELCRKLMEIALLSIDDISDAFMNVSESIATTTFTDSTTVQRMNDLLAYYEQEWLPRPSNPT